ncbi:uncharacterized protein LOC143920143 [Arctopsyche grandis]|uniref:uncharacterized protein LOC143920143 n=1 Tax=Arctopsyche grandis TaxID=121162 RepID=UPI00406D6D96
MPPKKDSEGEVVIQEVIDFNTLTKFIKRYDGSSIPLYEFIDDCENALILASESQRKILLNYIVSQITGSARIIISNINTRDFNSIKEALVRNYSPHKNYSTLLLELQQLKQRHDEDVTKFMNRIQTATNSLIKSIQNCNIKSKADEFNGQIKLIDELSLQRMIHGNKCQQTRIVFYSTHPKTLLDAYKTALEIETDTARNKNCNICGREGHSSNTCFKNKDSRNRQVHSVETRPKTWENNRNNDEHKNFSNNNNNYKNGYNNQNNAGFKPNRQYSNTDQNKNGYNKIDKYNGSYDQPKSCTYCNLKGHTFENCYKRQNKEQRDKNKVNHLNLIPSVEARVNRTD